MDFKEALNLISQFQGSSLTKSLELIENQIVGADEDDAGNLCQDKQIDSTFLNAALLIKQMAGQINVVIHAAGILHSLQTILNSNERVESVSLGAGNTGKKFDLETNQRVAEYKFIDWQGGSEAIRQNGVFKDFYELAEYETNKEKYLYVVNTYHPLKFFNGRRAISSVLSKQPIILASLESKYGETVKTVRDYYRFHKHSVNIVDISEHIGRTIDSLKNQ